MKTLLKVLTIAAVCGTLVFGLNIKAEAAISGSVTINIGVNEDSGARVHSENSRVDRQPPQHQRHERDSHYQSQGKRQVQPSNGARHTAPQPPPHRENRQPSRW